jgi:ABC transporter substrate binding protein
MLTSRKVAPALSTRSGTLPGRAARRDSAPLPAPSWPRWRHDGRLAEAAPSHGTPRDGRGTPTRGNQRRVVVSLILVPLAAPLDVGAGFLTAFSPSDVPLWREGFRQGLRDLGYTEGQNIVIEYRYAEGRPERLPGLAAELVRLKMDIIAAETTPASLAVKQATATIPIVMTLVADPVESGLVSSLARPGETLRG